MVTFLVQLEEWGLKLSQKRDFITDTFLRNLWNLLNIIFTFAEDYWATPSDFQ